MGYGLWDHASLLIALRPLLASNHVGLDDRVRDDVAVPALDPPRGALLDAPLGRSPGERERGGLPQRRLVSDDHDRSLGSRPARRLEQGARVGVGPELAPRLDVAGQRSRRLLSTPGGTG